MFRKYYYRPSKKKIREFIEKMNEIDQFCCDNGIRRSKNSDSYYFVLNDKRYRLSNHTIQASNRGAFDEFGNQIRPKYHDAESEADEIQITASKTRLIEIYNNLKAGLPLDKRGYVKHE